MMRLQLMLMSAKLKIVRLQFRNGAIWALIALFLANQIAPIVHDLKMNIINLFINMAPTIYRGKTPFKSHRYRRNTPFGKNIVINVFLIVTIGICQSIF